MAADTGNRAPAEAGGRTAEGPPPAPEALAVADAVAEQFHARARAIGLVFASATTAAERAAVFQLRHDVVLEKGWASEEDLPDGLEQDEHDADAIQVMGIRDGRLIATCRIILPVPGRLLPMEAFFGLRVEPVGRVVEAGRAIVRREHSDIRHLALGGLLAATWIEARRHELEYVCGPAARPTIRLFERMGYRVSVLGPARRHWGEDRFPVRFDVPESAASLMRWLPDGGRG
jgi:N-acyl-L-homoserine lactone synthetase